MSTQSKKPEVMHGNRCFTAFTFREEKERSMKCQISVMNSFLQSSDPCPYLDVSAGIDFVNSVSGGSARLSVQVVTLNEHSVVTEASHPHVSLALTLQLNSFADVKPGRQEETGKQWK